MPTGVYARRTGSKSPVWRGRNIKYRSAHTRVVRLWGKAAQYPCVSCGGPAEEWAYDGADPDELVGGQGCCTELRYSPDPEFYMPLCKPCHRHRDSYPTGTCVNGHPMTPDNVYELGTKKRCRACIKASQRQTYLRRKERARVNSGGDPALLPGLAAAS